MPYINTAILGGSGGGSAGGNFTVVGYTTSAQKVSDGLSFSGLEVGKKYVLVLQGLSTNSSHAIYATFSSITNATYEVIHQTTSKSGESTSSLYETIVAFTPTATSIHVNSGSSTVALLHGFVIGK